MIMNGLAGCDWTWAVAFGCYSVGAKTEEFPVLFRCFFGMALGEEFRFEVKRSMLMWASEFECIYSKFDGQCCSSKHH